ncbi:MAG: UbiD family decarboxylase, partial [Halobacteria archaeon]|nr:UbiD family decarboxylase [Halobacteria archaeon]
MAYDDLRDFIDVLDEEDELSRVEAEVDPHLEIAEITDRVSRRERDKNKALLFENVKGSEYPVLINAMGSRRRTELGLEVDDLDDIAERIEEILSFRPPSTGGILGAVKNLDKVKEGIGKLREFANSPPKTVKSGPC